MLWSLYDHPLYNVYEYPYLVSSAPPFASNWGSYWRVGVVAIFSFVTQLSFFLVLSSYNIVKQNISINPKQDYFV